MTAALIVFFMLQADGRWEFLSIEPTDSAEYCAMLEIEVHEMFSNTPGNMKVACIPDLRIEI